MLNLKLAFCLWLGCCSGAQLLTRPTLVQTEARKWVFFFCSKVISIIITKSTAVRTRSTEHGCALSVKWLLCNLHDNKAVHGGRDRNEGRWWGSHTYLSKQKAEQVRAKFCYNLSCTKKLQAPTRGNRCVCACVCLCAESRWPKREQLINISCCAVVERRGVWAMRLPVCGAWHVHYGRRYPWLTRVRYLCE